jgi:hypothetical protein
VYRGKFQEHEIEYELFENEKPRRLQGFDDLPTLSRGSVARQRPTGLSYIIGGEARRKAGKVDRQSEVTLLVNKLSEMGKHKAELDAVIRRYVPKDGDVLVPKPIDPVLERLKKMTAEELLPFVTAGTPSRKQITQSLREGRKLGHMEQGNLALNVVRGNLLPDEVSARAVGLAEWTKVNDTEIAALRSRYQVILDKFAEVEQQIKETETKYESLTNLYEVKVSGTETRTQARGVSGTVRVRALSVEEAIEAAIAADVEWNGDGYYEDSGPDDSEYEVSDEVDESDVKVIEDNGSAKAAGV